MTAPAILEARLVALDLCRFRAAPELYGPDGCALHDPYATHVFVDTASFVNVDAAFVGGMRAAAGGGSEETAEGQPQSGATTYAAWTTIDDSFVLTPGRTVTKITTSSAAAKSITVKIARKIDATHFDIVYSEAFNHPGGGLATLTLATPFVVPATGIYLPAIYQPSAGMIGTPIATTQRSLKAGDATGLNQDFFAPETNNAIWSRVTYGATGPSSAAFSYRSKSLDIGPVGAPVVPAKGALLLLVNGAAVLNTDLTAALSRDGIAWATAPLVELYTRLDGSRVVLADEIDLSLQPAQPHLFYKVNCANAVIVGAALWSPDLG